VRPAVSSLCFPHQLDIIILGNDDMKTLRDRKQDAAMQAFYRLALVSANILVAAVFVAAIFHV
jgi:hypothetical protein